MREKRDKTIGFMAAVISFFCCSLTVTFPAPFLPLEGERHGLHESSTGMILGLEPFVQCIASILLGSLITISSASVMRLLIGGTMTLAGASFAFGFLQLIPSKASHLFVSSALFIRVIQAVSAAAIFNSSLTLIADMFPDNSVKMLSINTAIGTVGYIVGPAIGSLLYKLGSFWLVFTFIGGLLMTHTVAMITCCQCSEISFKEKSTSVVHHIPRRKILSKCSMTLSLFILFISAVQWSAVESVLEPELRHTYNLPEEQCALVFLLLSVTFTVSAPLAGRMLSTQPGKSRMKVVICSLLTSAAAFLLAGPSPLLHIAVPRISLLFVSLALIGTANGFTFTPAQDLAFDIRRLNLPDGICETSIRGFISGVWNSIYSLGIAIGMASSGRLTESTGWPCSMTVYAFGSLISAIVLMILQFGGWIEKEVTKTRSEENILKTPQIIDTEE
ncbi:MFS-type transporter SLC18B1-like [Watersipora subatra]|uniref:MFS-type transporter SLC18B1-like n=1 Tax=Watersipora subatra TaxID=2589382 RepID=UPI00355B20EF